MNTFRLISLAGTVVVLGTLGLVAGCNSDSSTGVSGSGGSAGSSVGSASGGTAGAGTGGTSSTGGTSATGGTSVVSSGGVSSSGGALSTGGASTGGVSSSGGNSSTGGAVSTGGNHLSGGSSGADAGSGGGAGGTSRSDAGISDASRGGAAGSSSGGAVGTGGNATGGAIGTGGSTSSFWPSAYKATTGSSGMNTGQDCMSSCHNHGFALGGTVYDSSGKPKSQVQIGIKLTSGQFISVFSGSDGNFYYRGSGLNLAGADIRVRDANGESQMPVNSASSGACNSCHTGSGTPRVSAL